MRLFENSHAFCGERELSDLGLTRLLKTAIGEDIKPLCTFLCEAPDTCERQQRRAFFRDVAAHKDKQSFLRAVQAGAHSIEKIKQLYGQEYTQDTLYWFRHAQSYIEAVQELAAMRVEDAAHSERFCALVGAVRREYESEGFQALCQAVQSVLSKLADWRTTAVWYQVTESAISSSAWIPDTKERSFSQRVGDTLLRLFGDAPAESQRPLSLSTADEYLRQVCAKDPCVAQSLEALAMTAKRYTYLDFHGLSQDIRIVWNMVALMSYVRERSVPLCEATVRVGNAFSITNGIDISLLDRTQNIIPNAFCEEHRLSVLHGANSGGKTAFMRMVGICTAFAMWGLPAPAESMSCPEIEQLRTVFTMTESLSRGRLSAEQDVLADAVKTMNANTLLLVNEVFSSTNEADAVALSQTVLQAVCQSKAWCLWNTHHVLPKQMTALSFASYSPIVDENGNRCYVIRKQAHASSKASDIAARYRLGREQLTARLRERRLL